LCFWMFLPSIFLPIILGNMALERMRDHSDLLHINKAIIGLSLSYGFLLFMFFIIVYAYWRG
jgi:hypothetical protein